jgi:hypothetical protein
MADPIIANPATFADLVANLSASTASVAADQAVILAGQTSLAADQARQNSDTNAVNAEVQAGGGRYVVNADGSATAFELGVTGEIIKKTLLPATAALTPPKPTPAPTPEPVPTPPPA